MEFENEMAIQRYWAKHPFQDQELRTGCDLSLRILNPGRLNTGSGPDFTDAAVQIDSVTWYGSVEIHTKTSEWSEHKHHLDPAYNNVILHVVLQHDKEVFKESGDKPVVLCLPLQEAQKKVTTSKTLHEPQYSLTDWGEKRLRRKAEELMRLPEALRGDHEALFHRLLFSAYGIHQNVLPFEQLAVITSCAVLRRERSTIVSLEALLFGQSGLLHNKLEDEYPTDLLRRYETLSRKYQLRSMDPVSWKQMRMRPANFPCVRISQLAVMLSHCDRPMNLFMNEKDHTVLRKYLNAEATEYWSSHYRFDSETAYTVRSTGQSFLDAVITNAIAVMKYFLGELKGDDRLRADAMELLILLRPEKNSLIAQSGLNPGNALESQAVLEIIRSNRY